MNCANHLSFFLKKSAYLSIIWVASNDRNYQNRKNDKFFSDFGIAIELLM